MSRSLPGRRPPEPARINRHRALPQAAGPTHDPTPSRTPTPAAGADRFRVLRSQTAGFRPSCSVPAAPPAGAGAATAGGPHN